MDISHRQLDGSGYPWNATDVPLDTYMAVELYLTTSIAIFLLASGLILNALTLAVIVTTPALKTRSSFYIKSLTIMDLVVGLWPTPLIAQLLTSIQLDTFDPSLCAYKSFHNFIGTAILMRVMHLAVIAIDRCIHVSAPHVHKASVNGNVNRRAILIVWVIGLLHAGSLLALVFLKRLNYLCFTRFNIIMNYLAWFVAAIFFTCVVIIIVVYGQIFRIALKQRERCVLKCNYRVSRAMTDSAHAISTTRVDPTATMVNKELYSTAGDPTINKELVELKEESLHLQKTENRDRRQWPSQDDGGSEYTRTSKQSRHCLTRQESGRKTTKFFMTLTVYFIFFYVPAVIGPVFASSMPPKFIIPRLFVIATKLLAIAGSSTTFLVIHCLYSSFREGLRDLLRCVPCARSKRTQ